MARKPEFRYRRGWWGRLILQIHIPDGEYHGWWYKWRDARVEDLDMVSSVNHAMEVEK